MPPTILLDTLAGVRRRVRWLSVAFGAGLVVATAITLLLAVVLVDWALNLATLPRLLFVFASLGAIAYVLAVRVVRPLLLKLSISDLAGHVERAFPQFDDRLRSTVNFLRGEIPGSEPMKQRVVAEANKLASNIDINQVILMKPVWYSLAGGFGAVIVLAALAILAGPNFLQTAANRLVGGTDRYPKTVEIVLDNPIPQRVPVGRSVPIKIRLAKGADRTKSAVIYYRYDNGPWQQELMTKSPDGTYAASLDAKLATNQQAGSLQVKLQARDDEMILAPIAVVPRLDVAHIDARVTPPPYAGKTVTAFNLVEKPAVMAVGSTVDVAIAFNKALAESPVGIVPTKPGQELPRIEWRREGDHTAVIRLEATSTFRFTVQATDADGFQNTGVEEYELIVREDSTPTVQIEEPRRSEDRTPEAKFPLKVVAEDDYGIETAQLMVARVAGRSPGELSAPGNKWVIDLVRDSKPLDTVVWTPSGVGADRHRFAMEYIWSLQALEKANLKPGDVLEYFVQVKDNFNLNGQQHDFVPSGKLRVTIISQEQATEQYRAAFEQIHNEVTHVRKGQLGTKNETDALAERAKTNQQFDQADREQASRLTKQQGTAAAQTKQIASKLGDLQKRMEENQSPDAGMKQTASDVSKQLEQAAEGTMKDAAKNLDEAKDQQPADPKANQEQKAQQAQKLSSALNKASENQQAAADKLQQAMDKLGDFGGLSPLVQKMQEISDRQRKLDEKYNKEMKNALGKKPEDLTQQEKDALKEMTAEQDKLQKQTEAALNEMAKKGEQMKASDPASSEALKQAAKTGQQQAIPSKQQQSSQSMQQNQQAQAQQAQKQVELGLEMVLNKLKEAERRKLEELRKQLMEMQKLVAELIRRQAGHNLDNRLIVDPKLEKLSLEDLAELMTLSERDPNNKPPVPGAAQLSAGQEQTERNARDVAKTAQQLPDPGPSARITSAAGQMERAIVHLRAAKLPEAYEPPQVQALKDLNDAKAAIDEAQNKIDDQLKQEEQETVRQAYVKLLEEQKKLNADTTRINDAKVANKLTREDSVKLGQLPGAQGKLSEKATELGKQLQQIKSLVYSWANRDIVKSMDEVKDSLARPETGEVTQAEQHRIAEQLTAMIENLKQSPPKDPKFANRNNGGGGAGQGKPKPPSMPTEAELRLLKDLQQAVNKSTKTINDLKAKDAQKLLALGGRQGELRNLLDSLLQASTQGKMKLGEEPANKDQLPEEASKEAVEDDEFEKGLLNDDLQEEPVVKTVKLVGDRMARSRQRLATNSDPGQTTQEIQKRIVMDLDLMIKLAQDQQQKQQASGKPKPGQQPGQPQPGQAQGPQQVAQGKQPGQPQNTGQQAAPDSSLNQGNVQEADLSKEMKEKLAEWGRLTERERQAVMEGATDKTLEKYKSLVEDYYREVAKKATER